MAPRTMKSSRTSNCATRNGGSVWVGASDFKSWNLRNIWTTRTKTFKYRGDHGGDHEDPPPGTSKVKYVAREERDRSITNE